MKTFLLCILCSVIGFVVSPSNCAKNCHRVSCQYNSIHYVTRCYCEDLEEKCAGCIQKGNCKEIDKKCPNYEKIRVKHEQKCAGKKGTENPKVSDEVKPVDNE